MKVAIVDAFSTGNQIHSRLLKRGVSSFHIQSTPSIPQLLKNSFRQSDFDINYIYKDNLNDLLMNIASQTPTHVIAGSETGVYLADKIAHELKLAGNDFSLTLARRNKYLMIETIKNAGLDGVWQTIAYDLNNLLSEITVDKFPLIMKPLSSSSSDGFHICWNKLDVEVAYNNILGKKNILDEINEAVVCQSFLQGVQYIVNSVSYNAKHYITDIWEMQHRHLNNASMVIDSMTLLSDQHGNWKTLVKYAEKVLSALGLRFGPAHTEIMLTESGASLIEINARLMGGNIDACFKEALNDYDQIDAVIDSIISPEQLHLKLQNGYKLKTHIAEIDFIFYKGGILREFCKENEIRNLETFKKFSKMPSLNSHVEKTNNTTNVEGLLYLSHEDLQKVVVDRDQVVSWQRDNLIFNIENVL